MNLAPELVPQKGLRGRRNPLYSTLPERLRRAREKRGIAQAPLSVAAGLSRETVRGIETEGRIPGIDTVERLARSLGLSPCDLAYGVEGAALGPLVEGVSLVASSAGQRLQQLREHRGLSLRGLGRDADLSATAIGNFEAGKMLPSVAAAEALAAALACSPCWLAYGEGPSPLEDPAGAAAEVAALHYRPPRSPRKPPAPRKRRRRT